MLVCFYNILEYFILFYIIIYSEHSFNLGTKLKLSYSKSNLYKKKSHNIKLQENTVMKLDLRWVYTKCSGMKFCLQFNNFKGFSKKSSGEFNWYAN